MRVRKSEHVSERVGTYEMEKKGNTMRGNIKIHLTAKL